MRLETKGLEKWYFRGRAGSNRFFAVQKAAVTIEPGRVTVLMGRSGSGKTTLLQMMAGLLRPDGGSVLLDDQDLYALSDKDLCALRSTHFGLIPQGADLLPHLTVMENILLPLALSGACTKEKEQELTHKAEELLEQLSIRDLSGVRGGELSGGEKRRVCVVRALLGSPEVILADEPTSDLDDANVKLVLGLLKKEAEQGKSVFLVTHDREALSICDELYRMDGGILAPEKM